MLTWHHCVSAVLGAGLLMGLGCADQANAGSSNTIIKNLPADLNTALKNADDAAASKAKLSIEPLAAPKLQPNLPSPALPGPSPGYSPGIGQTIAAPPVPPRTDIPRIRDPALNGQFGGTLPLPKIKVDDAIALPNPGTMPIVRSDLPVPNGSALKRDIGEPQSVPAPDDGYTSAKTNRDGIGKRTFVEGVPKPGQSRDDIYGRFLFDGQQWESLQPVYTGIRTGNQPKVNSNYVDLDGQFGNPKAYQGIVYGQIAPSPRNSLDDVRSSFREPTPAELNGWQRLSGDFSDLPKPRISAKAKRIVGGTVAGTTLVTGVVVGTIFGLPAANPPGNKTTPAALPVPELLPENGNPERKPTDPAMPGENTPTNAVTNTVSVTVTNSGATPLDVFRALNTPAGKPWVPGLKTYQFETVGSLTGGQSATWRFPAGTILSFGAERYRLELICDTKIAAGGDISVLHNRRTKPVFVFVVSPGENSTFNAMPVEVAGGQSQNLDYPDGTTFLIAETGDSANAAKTELVMARGTSIELNEGSQ